MGWSCLATELRNVVVGDSPADDQEGVGESKKECVYVCMLSFTELRFVQQ